MRVFILVVVVCLQNEFGAAWNTKKDSWGEENHKMKPGVGRGAREGQINAGDRQRSRLESIVARSFGSSVSKFSHISDVGKTIENDIGGRGNCVDLARYCAYWRHQGLCSSKKRVMKVHCKKSCGFCTVLSCKDQNPYCAYWARIGECDRHQLYMTDNCAKSCRKCRAIHGGWTAWELWSRCSRTCGLGQQYRKRHCTSPRPQNGGRLCKGASLGVRPCNEGSCIVPTTLSARMQTTNQSPIKCGTRRPALIVSRIVGGSVAKPRDWPWQVALKRTDEDKIFCGGSLINEEWVVTAGHCLRKFDARKGACVAPSPQIRVIMGEFDLLNVDGHEVEKVVDQICLHPNYDYRTLDYDLALIHLKTPLTSFNEFVTPVCLPRHDSVTPVGTYCWVTGFGKTEEDSLLSNHLRQARVPTITRQKCREQHPSRVVSDRMFCAGYSEGGIDTCEGDSGGPFVCKQSDGRYELTGTISWGVGCGRANQPGGYTDMRLFRSWIDSTVNTVKRRSNPNP